MNFTSAAVYCTFDTSAARFASTTVLARPGAPGCTICGPTPAVLHDARVMMSRKPTARETGELKIQGYPSLGSRSPVERSFGWTRRGLGSSGARWLGGSGAESRQSLV